VSDTTTEQGDVMHHSKWRKLIKNTGQQPQRYEASKRLFSTMSLHGLSYIMEIVVQLVETKHKPQHMP